ncbi:MAG: MCE family protein [bacterium]|nr:MCE family protein [Candidatus Limimorpha caballi]
MENKRKSIIIGLSFIAALVVFIWGFNFLKGKSLLEEYPYYYAVYHNVDELAPADKVLVNGMLVGQVEELHFNPKKDGSIIVRFTVSKDVSVASDSKACINSSMLGSKSINLILGRSSVSANIGDTLTSCVNSGLTEMLADQIVPLKDKVETLVMSIDTLVIGLNAILNPKTQAELQHGISDLSASMDKLKDVSNDLQHLMNTEKDKISDIIGNADNIAGNLSAMSDSLSQINYNQLVTSLQSTLSNLELITTNLKDGEGSAGLLLKDDSLYVNLTETVDNIGSLIKKIEENPKKYIRVKVF